MTTEVITAGNVAGGVKRELAALRRATDELVGTLFYETLLKTIRESPLKGEYGHGGRAEEVFGSQLDAIRAHRMSAATRGGLSDLLYESLKQQQARSAKQRAGA